MGPEYALLQGTPRTAFPRARKLRLGKQAGSSYRSPVISAPGDSDQRVLMLFCAGVAVAHPRYASRGIPPIRPAIPSPVQGLAVATPATKWMMAIAVYLDGCDFKLGQS